MAWTKPVSWQYAPRVENILGDALWKTEKEGGAGKEKRKFPAAPTGYRRLGTACSTVGAGGNTGQVAITELAG